MKLVYGGFSEIFLFKKKAIVISMAFCSFAKGMNVLLLVAFIVLLTVVGFVWAYNSSGTGGDPAAMGHSVDEIDWSKPLPNDLYVSGNVGIGTPSPTQKLDVIGYVRGETGLCINNDCRTTWPAGGNDILMAGTEQIVAYPSDPDAGISEEIDVSSFDFSSPDDYQVFLTPQTSIGGPVNQDPCFSGVVNDIVDNGCFGPLWWPVIANKTDTSFRILVHDNVDNDFPNLQVLVDYIVVKH